MKPTKLKIRAPDEVSTALAMALVSAVGSPDFAARLMQALARELVSSHCTIFALGSNARVQAVSTASAIGEVAALTAIEYMRLGFDQQDSNMLWLVKRKPSPSLQLWIGHQFAQAVANERYRRVCYAEAGIRERLSVLAVFPDGYRVAVNLYRHFSHPDFQDSDAEWLSRQAHLVCSAVMRHVQVSRQAPTDPPLSSDQMASLSGRERQVISHVMAGMSMNEVAEELGISNSTALTYRYRAFQHLGIRTHRELLALMAASAPRAPRQERARGDRTGRGT